MHQLERLHQRILLTLPHQLSGGPCWVLLLLLQGLLCLPLLPWLQHAPGVPAPLLSSQLRTFPLLL
jgi:hypothetical protein